MDARSLAQRQQEEEKKRKMDKIWKQRVEKVKLEMEEHK